MPHFFIYFFFLNIDYSPPIQSLLSFSLSHLSISSGEGGDNYFKNKMNLTKFLTTIVTTLVLLLAATATTASAAAAAARQRQERKNTCQGKYSIGGTADLVIADGTLVYPDSKDQCQYGIKLLAEGATEIRIKCCVKKTCGKDFIGVCQDQHKNCKGSLVVYVFFFF